MAKFAIQTRGLTKDFGDEKGIFHLDLDVPRGAIYGFLGPNGAGKTTAIRTILGLQQSDQGHVRILDLDPLVHGPEVRSRIGYIPGELHLDESITGRQFLQDMADLRDRSIKPALAIADNLGSDLDVKIRRLSKGNKQKLGIIQAFFHEPDVLILDEPTDGLDPLLRTRVHAMMRDARDNGQTVFVSSHIIREIEQVCDLVAILRQGRLELRATLESLRSAKPPIIDVRFTQPVHAREFRGLPGIAAVHGEGLILRFELDGPADALIKRLALHNVRSIHTEQEDLEEIFLHLYAGDKL